jgi:hypothetical protein
MTQQEINREFMTELQRFKRDPMVWTMDEIVTLVDKAEDRLYDSNTKLDEQDETIELLESDGRRLSNENHTA